MLLPINEICGIANILPQRVKNIYIFGSRIYGTYNEQSDIDIYMIANTSLSSIEIKHEKYNIHIDAPNEFFKKIKDHHPGTLECLLAPAEFKIIENLPVELSLDIKKIKHSFIHSSDITWKRAIMRYKGGDSYSGAKKIFHSLRILDFAYQIINYGVIHDFSSMNYVCNELMGKLAWDVKEIIEEFTPLKKELLRKL